MPIVRQKWIFREDLCHNPNVLYLFGDNEQRAGLGGQAKEMRGQPNAVGVATKKAPGTAAGDYWNDAEYERCCEVIDNDLSRVRDHLYHGGTIVIPMDGLGTGLSELPQRAPKIWNYLVAALRELEGSEHRDYYNPGHIVRGSLARPKRPGSV